MGNLERLKCIYWIEDHIDFPSVLTKNRDIKLLKVKDLNDEKVDFLNFYIKRIRELPSTTFISNDVDSNIIDKYLEKLEIK